MAAKRVILPYTSTKTGLDIVNESRGRIATKMLDKDMKQHLEHLRSEVGSTAFYSSIFGISEGSSAYEELQEMEVEKFKEDFHTKLTPQNTYGLFLTVSPDPEKTDAFMLFTVAHKYFSKKRVGFLRVVWSIEQNGGDGTQHDFGYHPHVHALVYLNKGNQSGEPGKAGAALLRAFKAFNHAKASIFTKAVSKDGLKDKYNYVTGNKTDERKVEMVENDKLWRSEQGWEDFYDVVNDGL